MSATTTDQVNIDIEHQNVNKQQINSLSVGDLVVDGSYSLNQKDHSNHNNNNNHNNNRHGNSGSHHFNKHSGESDVDDKHRMRRSHRRSRSRSRSPSHRTKRATDTAPPTEKDLVSNTRDVEPLLVTDTHRKKHTELDDNDSDENVDVEKHEQHPGVDDGFFTGTQTDDDAHNHSHTNDHNVPHENPQFPYAPGFNPNVITDTNGNPQVIPDINVYQQKKNLAQGMMDLALLSANANQLRYVVETYARHPYYWFSLISIVISLILQVAVGVGLILNSRYNVKNKEQICRADKINNFTIIGVFLITTVNVFITAFGVAPEESKPN